MVPESSMILPIYVQGSFVQGSFVPEAKKSNTKKGVLRLLKLLKRVKVVFRPKMSHFP